MRRETKLYVWYCPKTNKIDLVPVEECREYKTCRWDKCAYLRINAKTAKSIGAFFYIGEL